MPEDHSVDPRFLAIFQLEMSAQLVRECMASVYDGSCSFEQRRAAIGYLFAQTRHIEQMCKTLYSQYHDLERMV